MSLLSPSLHFRYLSKMYIKNTLAILFGLSFTFAIIDYFHFAQHLDISPNYKILYIFYKWEEATGLLYPLTLVFALIMTKLTLVKNNTMGALHAFGYDKKRLFFPLLSVASVTYVIFLILNTTEFAYAQDKAGALIKNELDVYDVNDVFFKYNDTFVYVKRLDPVKKIIKDITIFKVEGHQVRYTINAPKALFDGTKWHAKDATVKTHIYEKNILQRYTVEHKENIETLEGYKPKIIESLYEGKPLNTMDAYQSWSLLDKQALNTDTIRAGFYDKVVRPLFALALLLILFFKLPFHARMVNLGAVIAFALAITFAIWGLLYGLSLLGSNGILIPELTAVLPIVLLWIYAVYVYFTDEKTIG